MTRSDSAGQPAAYRSGLAASRRGGLAASQHRHDPGRTFSRSRKHCALFCKLLTRNTHDDEGLMVSSTSRVDLSCKYHTPPSPRTIKGAPRVSRSTTVASPYRSVGTSASCSLAGDVTMPATEFQGSFLPFASIGRSILSNRRDHAVCTSSMDGAQGGQGGSIIDLVELEAFQQHVADLFHGFGGEEAEILSIEWIRKLLDVFLVCQEEFRNILGGNKAALSKPPLDRLTSEFFERSVKALDVCNAIRDGIDQVRNWGKHLEIVLVALGPKQRTLGEGQFRRAKKALTDLTIAMLDEKEAASSSSVIAHRNRSFGRSNRDNHRSSPTTAVHFRSLSWSVSRNWSAAKQLQAIGSNLTAPRSSDIIATNGFAVPIFTMNSVLLFVMWALVAAIPCQDRGLQTHFSIPRGFIWAAPIMSLHERIMEESKKRDRKNSNGLLKEISQIEKFSRHLTELMDSTQFPFAEEKESEIRAEVEGLAKVCGNMCDGLDPLESQVREVFHRIVRSRTEGLDSLGHSRHY